MMRRHRTHVLIVLASTVVLAAHAAYYYPFVPDDAFISFRYARRLLQGLGLTWTSGPPVEGYSNFLWTVLIASLGRLGFDLIVAARFLGAVSSVAVIVALVIGSARYRLWSTGAAAAAASVWVLGAPVGAWTLAGLEQPLVAALLAWTVVECLRLQATGTVSFKRLLVPGALLGALALVRLDAPLFVALVALWWWAAHGCTGRAMTQAAALLVIPVALLAGQQAFRVAYYGDWLPNVAHAKLAITRSHFTSGLGYVGDGLASLRSITELALVAFIWGLVRGELRARASLPALLLVAWLLYVAMVGRDLFPAWRQLLPAFLCMTFAVALGIDAVRSMPLHQNGKRLLTLAGAIVLVVFVWNQFREPENQRAKSERWEWNGEPVGRALKEGFAGQEPLLAVMAAGAVPYWAEIDCLDMFGLMDRHIARVRNELWGEGKLGHETRDADYVLSRRPDLMLFGTPGGHTPDGYVKGMEELPAFRDNYQRCNISGDEPRYFNSRMWVNRNSPRIGIRRDGPTLEVPSYLLNLTGSAIARLDDAGRFYVPASPEAPVGIAKLELAPGRWVVQEPRGAMRFLVNHEERGFREAHVEDGVLSFTIDSTDSYDILIMPRADTLHVYRLLLVHEMSN